MPNQTPAYELLKQANTYLSPKELSQALEVSPSTLTRWLSKESAPKPYITNRLEQILLPFEKTTALKNNFKFIDLFAGIGGIRQAFEHIGGHCVFTSEWDTYSQKTYQANYNDLHNLNGDITEIDEKDIPDHDVLLAGFPCQPFSLAGVSKKNSMGRAHGFSDETQGTLFFDVARIIAEKRPQAFVLENVKNLKSHDKGRTLDVIMRTLTEELGYEVHSKVIDGQHWTPQHRERIVIIGFKEKTQFSWERLSLPSKNKRTMSDIFHKTDGTEPYLEHDKSKYFDHCQTKILEKYTLSDKLWAYLQAYAAKHKAKGNGFGFGLVYPNSVSRTLSARYHKDGSEILVWQGNHKNPRRLTPRECARLMGYGDNFIIPVSDTRAYQQFGNSVVMPAFKAVAELIKPIIIANKGH
ncbi:MAG: DNA (cytosine-5-)-methyltransferase [Thiotrichales bacterium]|nr:DNA (cytosine-5-)-methyltransferase [Thiotrichales bacterium]